MNWGFRIVISIIIFSSIVFYMVFRMITSGNDLLRTKYYQSGPEINSQLKLMESSEDLNQRISFVQKSNDSRTLQIILADSGKDIEGELELICLSSDRADVKVPLTLEKQGKNLVQDIELRYPQKGTWLAEIKGSEGGKPFLIKRDFHWN